MILEELSIDRLPITLNVKQRIAIEALRVSATGLRLALRSIEIAANELVSTWNRSQFLPSAELISRLRDLVWIAVDRADAIRQLMRYKGIKNLLPDPLTKNDIWQTVRNMRNMMDHLSSNVDRVSATEKFIGLPLYGIFSVNCLLPENIHLSQAEKKLGYQERRFASFLFRNSIAPN